MKLITLFLVALFTFTLHAQESTISATPYNFVKINIGHGKPHLLELGAERCHSCQIMGKTLYKVKNEYPNYNISYINVSRERHVAMDLGVQMIPTQIVYDAKGKEVYRHVGKLSESELSEVFKKYQF
jgi:thioredoxin 1